MQFRCAVSTLLILLLVVEVTSAQVCSAAAKTLTTSCKNFCGDFEPCVVTNSTDCQSSSSGSNEFSTNCTSAGDDGCAYTCFQSSGVNSSDPTQVIVMISFDDEDNSGSTSYATADNDIVTSIGQLILSRQTHYLSIQGGSVYQQLNKGRVVQLELDDNFLTSQTQLTAVSLVSINLFSKFYDVPSLVPGSTTDLSLSNTLLTEFPTNLMSLQNVTKLYLASNYITTVNSWINWEKLTLLDLYQNNLSTFEGNFPGLTDLYLSDNNLTEIPAVVFTLQNLTKLTIQNNPLVNRNFTEEQINFLQSLSSLDLTSNDFQSNPDCSLSDQRTIGDNNTTVCAIGMNVVVETSAPSSSSSSHSATHITGSTSLDNDISSSSNGASQASTFWVVATVTFVVVIALATTGAYYWKQHKLERAKGVYNNMQRASSKHRTMTIWDDPELLALHVNCDDIQDIKLIGSGSFDVWLVRYRDSELLASKRIRGDSIATEHIQAFVEEMKLASKLDHPNIAALVGAAWKSGSDIQALFEFVENGDLRSYLSAPSLPRYWTRVKVQLAVDVIEALVYVHSFTPPLVHQALKSYNILISADMRAKLTDVGISEFRSRNGTTTEIKTSRWLAPEIISGSGDYSQAADIFAYGVLLSELDTHALPYQDAVGGNDMIADLTILQMVASGNLRPTFSDTCPPIILELAKQSMSQDFRDRPPALKVAYALRQLQREAFNM